MKYVLDTHPLIWFLTGNPQLGAGARRVLSDPASDLILPAIALAEACWIVANGRTPIPSVTALLSTLDQDRRITVIALDRDIVVTSVNILAEGEMHDRQIVATAIHLRQMGEAVALLSRDPVIVGSGLVPIIW
jgi:PIN domain nuclease of toxin-antitoxin system